ncbi:Gfo/Idh/MocA family oxidoreductase [Schleiferiaceae bacterium]|nr:Gfo/Idh/MocA family oxidoreductase [Schleiferiaceae bacterium]
MKRQIAVIGAGQLGSRHLQGVLKSSLKFDVYVVDPFLNSLETAEDRANEIEHSHEVFYKKSVSGLPEELDLVIVATNSDVRLRVLKELLKQSKVDTLVLEKVLFQSLHEYDEAKEIIQNSNTKTFVNHARRMQELYGGLKNVLEDFKDEAFDIQFYGSNWGLGCNGLHLSDTISFLFNDTIQYYDNSKLDSDIIASKRMGFLEFTGTLSGKTIKDHRFRIISRRTEDSTPSGISMTLNAPSVRIVVNEGGTEPSIIVTRMNQGANTEIRTFSRMLFQSDLSKIIAEEALSGRVPQLTTYEDAMVNHKLFIESLLSHLNLSNTEKINRCPIT